MSTLDLIRLLRRALTGLRDAPDPSAVNGIARALVAELQARLSRMSYPDYARSGDAFAFADPATYADDEPGNEVEMAVAV